MNLVRGPVELEHGNALLLRINDPVFNDLGFRVLSAFRHEITFEILFPFANNLHDKVGASRVPTKIADPFRTKINDVRFS